jgi:hypothetical protein
LIKLITIHPSINLLIKISKARYDSLDLSEDRFGKFMFSEKKGYQYIIGFYYNDDQLIDKDEDSD